MEICKICFLQFKNKAALVSHLSNPKGKCKTTIKDYYDKFIRKEKEGICQICGVETAFCGISKGYISNICKHCKNKVEKTKLLKKETLDKKRLERKKQKEIDKIKRGYYKQPIECMICKENNNIYKTKSYKGLAIHIRYNHPEITIEEYYIKFLKTDSNEGKCKLTGQKTNFKNLREGYFKYKGKGTHSKDIEIQKLSKETIFKHYGVSFPGHVNKEKRIINYNKTIKKRKDLDNARLKLINTLKILTIDKTNKKQCQICGQKFNNTTQIVRHIKMHNILIKEYYDKFFKRNDEGICPISKLETTFDCLERGYYKYHKLFIIYSDEIKNGGKKSQIKYIREKVKSFEDEFNVEFVDIDNLNLIGDLTKIKCLKCNSIYENRFTNLMLGYGKCQKCYPSNTHVSKKEIELTEEVRKIFKGEILTSYNDIIKNPESGRKLELDIYIPSKKFAIEFNGLYWHSEMVLNEKAKHCHIIKWNECKKNDIQLIQIFEDEWVNKKEIILSMIKHKLNLNNQKRIYARQCKIKEISSIDKNKFLEENHIQGGDYSKIKIGGFYNDKLISVMTFGLGNISRGGNPNNIEKWELSRFCTKKEYQVIGIAGKLLEYFKRNYVWKEIYSYADLRFSDGNLYKKIGFNFEKQNPPNYFYVKNFKRIYRYNLRKQPYEPIEIPEWRLRLDQGYYRIWDCGNLKFSMIKI